MNAVIFDFDGTIADSFDQVLAFLCSQCGRDIASISAEERRGLRGLSMRTLALTIGIPAWRLPLTYFRGKARLSKKIRVVQPFNGISDALAGLYAEDYQLFIISSNSISNINSFLIEHGLGGYFNKIYGNAGWFNKNKALSRAIKRHHLEAEKTVYVGDEVRDIAAAHAAGMPSVAVTWGFGSEEQLLQQNPTVVVRSPGEIQKALTEWGKS